MNNEEGKLYFEIGLDTSHYDKGIDKTVEGAKEMEKEVTEAFKHINGILVNAANVNLNVDLNGIDAVKHIDELFQKIGEIIDKNTTGIATLTQKMAELAANTGGSKKEQDALNKSMQETVDLMRETNKEAERQKEALNGMGAKNDTKGMLPDAAVRDCKTQMSALQAQINMLREQMGELSGAQQQYNEETEKAVNATETHARRIKNTKEEMLRMLAEGIDPASEAYRNLTNRLGELLDMQGDVNTEGRVMANDNAGFAGVLSGLQGITGGFSAAQGAIALFADENENLQLIMTKVQGLMAITNGLQEVSNMLNKDSAFRLTTVAKLKEHWNMLLKIGRGEQIAETAAVAGNTAAVATQTTATTAATASTIGFTGALKMLWASMMASPIGWIVGAIKAKHGGRR